MTPEKWLIHPGETRVIDIASATALKVGLVGGEVDIVAHDEPTVRIEVHGVTVKDLRVEVDGDRVEIDHPQLRWDNFLEVFRNFGSGGPKAEISVAVPRDIALTLGVVNASAHVAGLQRDARLNTVSGDIIVDGHTGSLTLNAVSGDVAATGVITKADVDTVSGALLFDSTGPVHQIGFNTVSGDATVRLDPDLAVNYVLRSVSGKVQLDGIVHRGNGPGVNFTGSIGELSGSFADVRVNSVSGDVTLLRHTPDAALSPEDGAR